MMNEPCSLPQMSKIIVIIDICDGFSNHGIEYVGGTTCWGLKRELQKIIANLFHIMIH